MDVITHARNLRIPRARRFEPQFVQHQAVLKPSPARPRAALIRRARPSMMVPVGQDSTVKHAPIPHGRVKLPRSTARGKRWDPAWSVQAAPVNPAWVAPITRSRLKTALLKHGRILLFPVAQDTPAVQIRARARQVPSPRRGRISLTPHGQHPTVPTPTRPRVKVATAARGRRTQPPWALTSVVPSPARPRVKPTLRRTRTTTTVTIAHHATIPAAAPIRSRGRPLAKPPRARAAIPPFDQATAPARPRAKARTPTPRRGHRTDPPWTVTTPITPAFVPRPTRPRQRAWWTRRGHRFDPAWPLTVAPVSPTICYPTSALIVSYISDAPIISYSSTVAIQYFSTAAAVTGYDTAATVVNYNSEVAITSYRTAAAVTSYSTDLAIVTYTSDAKLSTCGD